MAMVPASKGGFVASMHASPDGQMHAESTPVPQIDTSSSTDLSMSSNSHSGPSVSEGFPNESFESTTECYDC